MSEWRGEAQCARCEGSGEINLVGGLVAVECPDCRGAGVLKVVGIHPDVVRPPTKLTILQGGAHSMEDGYRRSGAMIDAARVAGLPDEPDAG